MTGKMANNKVEPIQIIEINDENSVIDEIPQTEISGNFKNHFDYPNVNHYLLVKYYFSKR